MIDSSTSILYEIVPTRLTRELPDEVGKLRLDEVEVKVKSYVGGLVKAFERKAA